MGNRPAEEITDGEGDVEILVGVFVVQKVMPGHELVGLPVGEESPLRLVHLKVNLIPDRVVQKDHAGPDGRTYEKCLVARQIADQPEYQA